MSFTIHVIDDDESTRLSINEYLKVKGYEIIEGSSLKEAKEALKSGISDIILLDVNLPDGYGLNLLSETAQITGRPPIIMITAYGDIEMAVDAMRNGAHDFISKPISDMSRLESSIKRAEEIVKLRRQMNRLHVSQNQEVEFVVGNTNQMKLIMDQAQKAAKAAVSVLITGESGTGKEVLARYIHKVGPRSHKLFWPENCAAIQSTMIEAELFGFEAHAFTGADKRKLGLMEVADEGVLFLDEISSITPDVQAKLLRAIEEQSFRRVGGTTLIKVDLQILAASNRNLQEMMKDGRFREDLYYRLKVVDLHLPTLRERKEDIPELVGFFLNKLNPKRGMNVLGLEPKAMQALIKYDWPGNIRELENVIERTMLFCNGENILLSDLPPEISGLK